MTTVTAAALLAGCPADEAIDVSVSGFETTGGDETTGGTGEVDACAEIEAAVADCDAINNLVRLAPQPPVCNGVVDGFGTPAPPEDDSPLAWLADSWPAPVDETDPALVGVWTPLILNQIPLGSEEFNPHLPVHSVHRPTGKFLQFGSDNPDGGAYDFNTDKAIWYPPAPCLDPFGEGMESCDTTFDSEPSTTEVESHFHVSQEGGEPDLTEFNLFCAGHVNLPHRDGLELLDPRTLIVGGSAGGGPLIQLGIDEAFTFTEALPDVEPITSPSSPDYEWHELDDLSSARWYPGTVVMSDSDVVVAGGVFNADFSLECRQEPPPAMPQTDDECACEEEEGDFYYDLGICGDGGYCDPNLVNWLTVLAAGFNPCVAVNSANVLGMDVGTRTGYDAVSWEEVGLGISWGVYPHLFVLPDLPVFTTNGTNLGGKMVMVGGESAFPIASGAVLWDPTTPEAQTEEIGGPSCTRGSSSVMYASDKILKFGGTLSGLPEVGGAQTSRLTEILDLGMECPQWRRPEGGALAFPRHYASGVLLPDGNVFTAGGGISSGRAGDVDEEQSEGFDDRLYGAFTTELFQRDSETWCRLADLPTTAPDGFATYRGYHSQSFLLPDGRVYLGAGGNFSEETTHYDYQLYAPPYLFWGSRPAISPDASTSTTNDITVLEAGGASARFARDNEIDISRVTLVKLSATTHQFDQEQRFVELEFSPDLEGEWIDVEPPPSTCYATPGYYMLFAISDLGVPSVARYVAVEGSCEAAAVTAVAPIYPSSGAIAVNDLRGDQAEGLRASCSGEGSTLRVDDFRQGLVELCAATRACPANGAIEIEVRFVSTTGQANADPNDLLGAATIELAGGVPGYVGDRLALDVAGTEFTGSVELGPGDHVLDVCATLDVLSACVEQPLRIDPVLAEDVSSEYRLGAIEPRSVAVDRLVPGTGLALGDDDVIAVALPDGFIFPYFDEEIDTVWVGANGGIRFTSGAIPATNAALPSTSGPDIALYWDDLDPSLAGRVATHAAADRFVIAWERVAVAAGGVVSAQIHLFRDGRIELHYPAVESGATPYGDSATIGIQFDGDALQASQDDDELLVSNRAFALDRTTCIASALRLPDSTHCADRVAPAPARIDICAVQTQATISVPAVPTMCAAHGDAYVSGSVMLDDVRQPVADDGRVTLFAGEYAARWSIHAPMPGALSPGGYGPVGEAVSQSITVALTDDEDVCCRDDQTTQVLTASNDGPMYVCTSGACCVVALAGNDNFSSGSTDDTLLGNEGADTMYGGGGADVVVGGPGDDWLSGGNHDDTILGGDGLDHIAGDAGNDVIHCGSGDDVAWPKDGDDQVWGGVGDDEINEYAYAGADTMLPGPGVDEVYAGSGDDHVVVIDLCEVEDGEVLDGGSGSDTLWLPAGADVEDLENLGAAIVGFEAVEMLVGTPWGGSECAA